MNPSPTFSLIVPTRQRTGQLRRLLDSLAETAAHPKRLEIVLVVDEDDAASVVFCHDALAVKLVVVAPGLPMGALNMAGYEAASAPYLMLLNDDVVARTPRWDETVLSWFRAFPDEILLIHTNDLIFKDELCTFPLVSHAFCELAGGLCPREYVRYRIDDHIGDVFNLLAVLGERRTIYLPDIVFEHLNFHTEGEKRVYSSEAEALAVDALRFDGLFPRRKEIALRLKDHIEARGRRAEADGHSRALEAVRDPFTIRVPSRLRVESQAWPRSSANTRVTVGVVASGQSRAAVRRCLGWIESHTANYELIVLDQQGADFHFPRELNRLLSAARTDHVALLHDQIEVSPGWLDGLLASMNSDVSVVTPLQQGRDRKSSFAGVVFHPDGSGHHSHSLGVRDGPQAVLTFCNPVLLIDRDRCRHLRFDETFGRYFFDLDLGLRVWECGWRVVCTPASIVRSVSGSLLPYGPALSEQVFEEDRRAFIARWMTTGRYERLQRDVWASIPELRRLAELETLECAGAVLEEIRRHPILEHALLERAVHAVATIEKEPHRLLRAIGSAMGGLRRIPACLRDRGYRGLAEALGSRLTGALRNATASESVPAPHPTRDARRLLLDRR